MEKKQGNRVLRKVRRWQSEADWRLGLPDHLRLEHSLLPEFVVSGFLLLYIRFLILHASATE